MDFNQRSRERRIAEAIAQEIHRVLGPTMPERLGDNQDIVCGVFADFFDSHQVVAEAEGARILKLLPLVLAKLNLKHAELQCRLDAAVPARPAAATFKMRD